MPRFMKGAKWVFGWVIVRQNRWLKIPPEAWARYAFQIGDEAVFIPGSRKSGGFALSTPTLLRNSPLLQRNERILGRDWFREDGCVLIPTEMDVYPGEKYLTVFGSGLALSFINQGPIYVEAQKHSELKTFGA
jgi:hypothetical protein